MTHPLPDSITYENTSTCNSGPKSASNVVGSASDLLQLARALAKVGPDHRAVLLAMLPADQREAVAALADVLGK